MVYRLNKKYENNREGRKEGWTENHVEETYRRVAKLNT
jgi:hypothetical protein